MCEGQINNVTVWEKKSRFVDFDHVYLFKGPSNNPKAICKKVKVLNNMYVNLLSESCIKILKLWK